MLTNYIVLVQKPIWVKEYDFYDNCYYPTLKQNRELIVLARDRDHAEKKVNKFHPESKIISIRPFKMN